jgi:hypothetical protein
MRSIISLNALKREVQHLRFAKMKVIKGLEFSTDWLDDLLGASLYTSMPDVIFLAHLLLGVEFLKEPLGDSHEKGKLIASLQNPCHLHVDLGEIGTKEVSVDNFL